MITAQKNNITRNFEDFQWKNMPKNKFGWVQVAEGAITPNITSADIIQKKMIAGQVVDAVKHMPDEIIIQKKATEKVKEILPMLDNSGELSIEITGKTENMKGIPAKGTQINDDLPEIKTKRGRPAK